MKKVLNIILSVILCLSVVSPCFAIQSFAETGDETTLKFKNGKFRILVFADPQDDLNPCEETLDLMYASIEAAKPDLVVFTGDNIHGPSPVLYRSKKRVEKAIRQIMEPVTSQNIPFAIVYGNHDDEGKVSKQFQMEVYNSMPGCLASEGEAMTGCGNYNLPIKSSDGAKNFFNLWCIDSGTYDKENGGYAHVAEDQLAWYKKTSDALKAENGGEPMPSLLFQHIPDLPHAVQAVAKVQLAAQTGNVGVERAGVAARAVIAPVGFVQVIPVQRLTAVAQKQQK